MKRRFYTKEETKIIRENIDKLTVEEIAKKINRSRSAVGRKLSQMKLKKPLIYSEKLCEVCGFTFRPNNHNQRICKSCAYKGIVNFEGYLVTSPELLLKEDKELWKSMSPSHRVLLHRLKMAKYIGRPLKESEVVHHFNGVRTDNRIENLCIVSNDEHNEDHLKIYRSFVEALKERIRDLEAKMQELMVVPR